MSVTGTDPAGLGGCGSTPALACRTITKGVNEVANLGGPVQVGPGQFTESTVGVDALRFPIDIIGAGAGTPAAFDPATQTRLSLTSSTPLYLRSGGSLTRIRVDAASPTDPALKFDAADSAATYGYRLQDVVGTGGSVLTLATGAAGGKLALDVAHSTLQAAAGSGVVSASRDASGGPMALSIEDANISTAGGGTGISTSDVDTQIRRSSITTGLSSNNSSRAMNFSGTGNTLLVERSRLVGGSEGLHTGGANAAVEVDNSLITGGQTTDAPGPQAALTLDATDGGQHTAVTARGSTIAFSGPGEGGVTAAAASSSDAHAALFNTLVRAPAAGVPDLKAATVNSGITASSSAFSDSSGTTSAPGSATNIAADPLITSDLGLGVGSPAIDRGSAAGSTGSLDLAGAPRALDGNGDGTAVPDIGAFERPAVSVAKDVAPSLSGVSMTNKTFAPLAKGAKASARKRKKKVKRGTRFRYRLSEAATVTVTVDRVLKGRRVKVKRKARCATPTRKNRKARRCKRYRRAGVLKASKVAGRDSTAFSGRFKGKALKTGTYRATIVARDPAGLTSKPRRLTFRIIRP